MRGPRPPLVNVNEIPPLLRVIVHANLDSSRLLQLPPEVRNRIYALVVGNRTLHYQTSYDQAPTPRIRDVCQIIEERTIDTRYRVNDPRHPDASYVAVHEACRWPSFRSDMIPPPVCLTIGLSRVCHQIYNDMALLPLALNSFDFEDFATLQGFAMRLNTVQIAAIQTIHVSLVPGVTYIGDDMRNHVSNSVLRNLIGLTRLTITLPGHTPRYNQPVIDTVISMRVAKNDVESSKYRAISVLSLGRLHLNEHARYRQHRDRDYKFMADRISRAWSRNVEKELNPDGKSYFRGKAVVESMGPRSCCPMCHAPPAMG